MTSTEPFLKRRHGSALIRRSEVANFCMPDGALYTRSPLGSPATPFSEAYSHALHPVSAGFSFTHMCHLELEVNCSVLTKAFQSLVLHLEKLAKLAKISRCHALVLPGVKSPAHLLWR